MLMTVKVDPNTDGMLHLLKKINEEQRQLENDILELGRMIRGTELQEVGDSEESHDKG